MTELINESSDQNVLKGRLYKLKYNITKQKFKEDDKTYLLYSVPNVIGAITQEKEYIIDKLSDSLKRFLNGTNTALVVGLGNRHIRSDSFGTECINKVIATRHLINSKREVSVIGPSVFGLTGIESADIIKSVCDVVKPDVVLLIDTLCANDYNNLITNIQISDDGFRPGAGVGNMRKHINHSTLNIRTISIGVPLVVYAKTLVDNAVGENQNIKLKDKLFDNLVVTTKDVDVVINKLSYIISSSINLALNDYSLAEQNIILDN